MLRITIFIGSLTILQSSIDMAEKNEVGGGESDGNETNLSNPSASKKSTKAEYLTSGGAKKGGNNPKMGGGNTKKGVEAARSSDYLTLDAKKAFNHLRHAFIQAFILQHFDPEWHIRIKTDVSGYAISRVLSQLTLNDLGQWHPVAYYSHNIIQAKT